jgi:hypothetical protein
MRLTVRALEAHLHLASGVYGGGAVFILASFALDRDAHRRSGVGSEGQEQVGPLASNGRVPGGVGSAPHGVLEEEGQGVKPRAGVRSREVEDHRRLAAGGHTLDDPGLPALAPELSDDVERTRGLASVVRDDDAHFETGNPGHDLAGDVQRRARTGARDHEKGKEKSEASTCGQGQT